MSAITFDAKTDQSMAGTATATQTFTHVTSGSNRFLAIGVTCEAKTVSSASYNGIAMTVIGPPATPSNNVYICYVANPASGSNTVSVTFSASNVFGEITAISFTGVNQTAPVDASGTLHSAATVSPAINVSSLLTGSLVLDAIINNFADTLTVNAGQTQRTQLTADTRRWAMSTRIASASGIQTMGWSSSPNSDTFDQVAIVIRQATPSFQPNNLRPAIFKPGIAK